MNKKEKNMLVITIVLMGLLAVAFSYFFFLSKSLSEHDQEINRYKEVRREGENTEERTAAEVPLSEFQITACNAADRSGTCNTRLPRLNLVAAEECCQYLGKCC